MTSSSRSRPLGEPDGLTDIDRQLIGNRDRGQDPYIFVIGAKSLKTGDDRGRKFRGVKRGTSDIVAVL